MTGEVDVNISSLVINNARNDIPLNLHGEFFVALDEGRAAQ